MHTVRHGNLDRRPGHHPKRAFPVPLRLADNPRVGPLRLRNRPVCRLRKPPAAPLDTLPARRRRPRAARTLGAGLIRNPAHRAADHFRANGQPS